MKTAKQTRNITVLVRYFIKATGNVVLYVENDKGDRYHVTLRSNGNAACNCKATRKCYHIARCTEMETARQEVATQFKAKSAPVWFVELVAKGVVVAPVKVVVMPTQAVVSPKVENDDILDRHAELMRAGAYTMPLEDISTRGNLNGNRGFSLLKVS